MCGIVGLLQARNPTELVREVAVMNETLRHRGPDDDSIAAGDCWALGACRLAIQDLSQAGRQPMVRGDLTVAFNGEIYNFKALRSELESAGHTFVSGSDTEVVLAAFAEWGTPAFLRFNGMFALAIIDAKKRSALLARDRWGKKPLFIARLRERIAFASELKAIVAVAADQLRIDRRALAHYFRYQYVPAPESIFSEVEKLRPGSWVEIDLATHSRNCGTFLRAPEDASSSDPVAEPGEVLEVVRRAVRRRLVADVPVGAFLSGGTDSSLVVACMRDAEADCRTFSIGFDDPRFDESNYALAVARHLGTVHTHRILRQDSALDLIADLPRIYDEPFADSSALPQLALAKLAREHVTVALSGDGGDELFGGYLRYRAARYLTTCARVPSGLSVLAPAVSHLPRVGGRLSSVLGLAAGSSPGTAYRELISIWRTPELHRLMPDIDFADGFAERFDTTPGGTMEQMMRCDAATYLIDDILQKVDRATMAASLEARNPLLDPAVAEVGLRSAPLSAGHPAEKPLLRAALRLVLPQKLVDRPKMGFGVPVGDWARTELRPLLEDLVLASGGNEYDTAVARRVCLDHLSGRRDAAHQVWSLLMFELWRDRWYSQKQTNASRVA